MDTGFQRCRFDQLSPEPPLSLPDATGHDEHLVGHSLEIRLVAVGSEKTDGELRSIERFAMLAAVRSHVAVGSQQRAAHAVLL